jgi:hypothetical protein
LTNVLQLDYYLGSQAIIESEDRQMNLVQYIVECWTENSYEDEPARDYDDAVQIAEKFKTKEPNSTVEIKDASWLYQRK